MNGSSPDANLELRRQMVREQICARGVRDPRVLAAMERVPRERFVPPALQAEAFSDRALAIDADQTISQPYIVAAMTEALDVRPYHRVLEIGTGSGYQTMVLALLAEWVYTVERIPELHHAARERLASLGVRNVSFLLGDGSLGWPDHAPYDRIIVTAGAPAIPPSLVAQLRSGGRLVLPIGDRREQTLTLVERWADRIRQTPILPCRFVQLIGQEGWNEPSSPESAR